MADGRKQVYNAMSDEEIATAYRQNSDKTYVGELYHRYGHLVLGLCLKYLRNRMDAEDAVVEIFAKLFNDLLRHDVRHFKSWLYVYSKNYCLMQLRKRQSALKKDLELEEDLPVIMDFPAAEHLQEREKQIMTLEQAIETLNDQQKRCIIMFYLENRSYIEIAAVTGLSGNEVKSHIQNGKRNLRIKLESTGDEKKR